MMLFCTFGNIALINLAIIANKLRRLYELPSASADGQCLKKDKALAESVKLIYSLQL
jgi:hypothetical protein